VMTCTLFVRAPPFSHLCLLLRSLSHLCGPVSSVVEGVADYICCAAGLWPVIAVRLVGCGAGRYGAFPVSVLSTYEHDDLALPSPPRPTRTDADSALRGLSRSARTDNVCLPTNPKLLRSVMSGFKGSAARPSLLLQLNYFNPEALPGHHRMAWLIGPADRHAFKKWLIAVVHSAFRPQMLSKSDAKNTKGMLAHLGARSDLGSATHAYSNVLWAIFGICSTSGDFSSFLLSADAALILLY
jgi:hypothetical protein